MRAAKRGEPWTQERWWAAIAQRSPGAAQAVRPIVEWAKRRMSGVWMGAGTVDGSLTPVVYMDDGRQFFPFILWTYGTIEIQFAALSRRPPFDRLDLRRELRDRLMHCRVSRFLTGGSISGPASRWSPSLTCGAPTIHRDHGTGA